MSQPQLQDSHTVAQHLGSLRRLINSLGVDGRGRFLAFLEDVRKSLNNQDATITAQQAYIAQLQRPSPIAPPARPRSSNSVVAIRQAMEQDMQAKAYLLMSRASRTVRSIYNLDPAWALNFVKEQRNENIRHELNCWMSGNAAAHPNDYTKINMRGTYMPGSNPPRKFPAQPFGHQMGIVAGGYGHMLLLTFPGGDYEVSHLCHPTACFNPDHLIVETKVQNKMRNNCHGSFVIRTADGTVIHPCTHWMGGARVQCILPVRDVPPAAVGKHVDMSLSGPVLRTGRSDQ
ncbi:hypothetical protein VE00_04696 [Pseudogymnoascus sp. WSF 3629]|nr:hypothetical protein VE00_04696 [Pseudogymnoascus sp. WSF 3629]